VAVLQEVDIDAATAVVRESDGGGDVREATGHHAGEELAELPALVEGAEAGQGDEDVEAGRARGLDVGG